jgi:hypothetical protein
MSQQGRKRSSLTNSLIDQVVANHSKLILTTTQVEKWLTAELKSLSTYVLYIYNVLLKKLSKLGVETHSL